MLWLVLSIILLTLMQIYDYYVLRNSNGFLRVAALSILVAGALCWPYLVPADLLLVRFLFAMIVFNKIIKSVEIAYNRVHDPAMVENFGRYLMWSSNFPDTIWSKTKEDKQKARQGGIQRIQRGILKYIVVGIFMAFSTAFHGMHAYYYFSMLWLAFLAYFVFSGLADLVTGMIMLSGVGMVELFNNPLLARSPTRILGTSAGTFILERFVTVIFFYPLGGPKRPLIATVAVFLVSVLLHEYMIFVCLGATMLGYMTAFFMIHCLATIIQTILAHKTGRKEIFPRWSAIIMHSAWLVLTLPLLAEPILKIIPITTWRLW